VPPTCSPSRGDRHARGSREWAALRCAAVDLAVGFAAHSGWAVAVVAGLDDGHLRVYDRRRVELISPALPRQAYHAAAGLSDGEGRELVATVDRSIAEHALDALSAIRTSMSERHSLAAVGIVGQAREIPDLTVVLASHALMHASEGGQYRRALDQAGRRLGLPVCWTSAQRLAPEVARIVGWSSDRLVDEHAQVRAAIGPPWQKDHKEAAAAALIALRSAG